MARILIKQRYYRGIKGKVGSQRSLLLKNLSVSDPFFKELISVIPDPKGKGKEHMLNVN